MFEVDVKNVKEEGRGGGGGWDQLGFGVLIQNVLFGNSFFSRGKSME